MSLINLNTSSIRVLWQYVVILFEQNKENMEQMHDGPKHHLDVVL